MIEIEQHRDIGPAMLMENMGKTGRVWTCLGPSDMSLYALQIHGLCPRAA